MRLGILFIAIFLVLEGFTSILFGASMMLAKEELHATMKEEFERILEDLNATHVFDLEKNFERVYEAVSFSAISIGVLYLIVAIGLIALRNWARILATVLLVLQLVYSLATIHLDLKSAFGVVLSLIFIWYLFRGDVRETFSGKKTIEERILGRKI